MAKVLWYGDAVSNTGFARVTHSVLDELHKKHDVSCVGINYAGDPHNYPYRIYPAANHAQTERFGLTRLPEILDKERPDVFICLNDIWVANSAWERVQFMKSRFDFKFMSYFPIDAQSYLPDMFRHLEHWDMAITFTVPCAERIMACGGKPKKLGVLPHGVDVSKFYPLDKDECRKELGLPLDKFIVFNGNRNQPRKMMDLTIKAFCQFAKDKPDTMLYLNMGGKDLGWDVKALFRHECERHGINPMGRLAMTTSGEINYTNAPDDATLNKIYNATDVGINTANGEGWGLVPFEHAACKKPQIVPNHTACADIWAEAGLLTNIATWIRDKDLGLERGLVDVEHLGTQLTELYAFPEMYDEVAEACYAVTQRNEYRWESIAMGFSKAIEVELAK